MIGLAVSIVLFNLIVFTMNKQLTRYHIVQIWIFTIAFHVLADTYIDAKLHGYWYFNKAIVFKSIPAVTLLIPPVNVMFLNWYPFKESFFRRIFYIVIWVIAILLYELLTLLPEPWGYFHYGWWSIWISMVIDPFLFGTVLIFYKWVWKLERSGT